MAVELVPATDALRPVLLSLMQLYLYDFSAIDGRDVCDDGRFAYPDAARFWREPDRDPWLLRVDGAWAGFAVIQLGEPHDINEFFVLRKYRRSGIGRHAVRAIFERYTGPWQIRAVNNNVGAISFWRDVIPADHKEGRNASGPVYSFDVAADH